MNYFWTAFFIEHLHWLILVTAINRRYSGKRTASNTKSYTLHNSVSVDMKFYSLQLKQKSTAGVSNGILQNFRTATFEKIFQVTYLLRHETIFLHRFSHCGAFQFGLCYLEPFNLDYVIHFINLRKGLVVEFFQVTYLLRHETIFPHRFSHCGTFQFGLCYLEPFNLDYVIHFINLRKGLVVEFLLSRF